MRPLIEEHVIGASLCQVCGGCYTVCPVAAIALEERSASVLTHCIECLACDKVCPVLDSYLGGEVDSVLEVHATRSAMAGQDGATVTAIFSRLFEQGILDCVVGAGRDEDWNPVPMLIEEKEDIPLISYSKYTYLPTLVPQLREAADQGFTRIGVAGVPCQCHCWDLCRDEFERYAGRISLVLGLFCMESFDRQKFLSEYLPQKGIAPRVLRKVDIAHGRLFLHTERKEISEKIKTLGNLVRDGCHSCIDFSSFFADISVGSVGSPDGWNTLIVRTKRGKEIWERVRTMFAVDVASIGEVAALSEYKRKMRFEEYRVRLPDLREIYAGIAEAHRKR